MGRPRKDRGPSDVGVLQPLKASVMKEDAPPVEEEDDDMMDEEAILSQQSMKERLFGENGVAKRKATEAAAAAAASSSRPKSTPRKRKSASPNTAARQSKRIASMSRPTYKDPVGDSGLEPPEPPNSDDDFQTDSGTPKKDSTTRIPKRRGRPPKRRRDTEPANTASHGGPVGSSQESVFAPGGSSQGSNGERTRLLIDFSPSRASRPTQRRVTEKQLDKWKIARQSIPFEERTIIMNEFRAKIEQPPNNARKAIWYKDRFGRDATLEELDDVNKAYFQPWSDEWWVKRQEFIDFCEVRKREKPLDSDPKVTKWDAKRWIKDYLKQYGNLERPEIPHKYRTPSKRRRLSRSKAEDVTEPQASADAVPELSAELTLDGRTADVVDITKKNEDVADVDAMAAVGETGKAEDDFDVDLNDAVTKDNYVAGNQEEMEGVMADADVGDKKLNAQMTVDLTEGEAEQPRSANTNKTFLGFSINLNERDGFAFDDTRSTLHLE